MTDDRRPRQRRQRGMGRREGTGQNRRRYDAVGRGQSSAGRTATRTLLALGTYAAQDLRDPDGVARPLLRRAALRLTACPSRQLRRIGGAYLRSDPPSPDELAAATLPPVVIGHARTAPAAEDPPASRPALPPATGEPGEAGPVTHDPGVHAVPQV